MLVPVDDILFHKGARKHRVRPALRPKLQEEVLKITASKKVEAEAIGCATAIVAGEERRLLLHLPTINPIFPPTMESTNKKVTLALAVKGSTRKRSREVERYKAKFKENKQLVNDTRKMNKALAEAIRLKDQNFESLKRLKRSIPTKRNAAVQEFSGFSAFHDAFRSHCIRAANFEKRKWMAVLGRYDNGNIIRKYRDVMDEYLQKGETFILAVDPSSDDDSNNKASIGEQSQESEDGPGDAEDCGDDDGVETQNDIVRGSALDEDDS
ncbi:unnamed protein product [Malus baccata var. baccata]